MLISQGILARSDNPTEVKQNKISQHWEYNCLNLKKCDERTNERTNEQTHRQTYVLSCAMRN